MEFFKFSDWLFGIHTILSLFAGRSYSFQRLEKKNTGFPCCGIGVWMCSGMIFEKKLPGSRAFSVWETEHGIERTASGKCGEYPADFRRVREIPSTPWKEEWNPKDRRSGDECFERIHECYGIRRRTEERRLFLSLWKKFRRSGNFNGVAGTIPQLRFFYGPATVLMTAGNRTAVQSENSRLIFHSALDFYYYQYYILL